MSKIIFSIFLVLSFLCSPAISATAVDLVNKAKAIKNTDPITAIEYLNKAIKLKPKYAEAYFNRGDVYCGLRQYQRAIEEFNKAIHLNPDIALYYIVRGMTYGDLGQHQLTIEDCNEAIRLKPDNAEILASAYGMRGAAYNSLRQYQRAIDDYEEAIRLQPSDASFYLGIAGAYFKQHNRILACRYAQKACDLGMCDGFEGAKAQGVCQ